MARIWTPKLAIGVPSIDAQHQELFKRADDLLEAMRSGKGSSEVAKLLGYLEQYVNSHFGAEEKLMQARKYPGFAQHKALHDEFRREFAAVKAMVGGPSSTASAATLKLNSLMGTWLVQHIGSIDTQLAASFGDQRAQIQL